MTSVGVGYGEKKTAIPSKKKSNPSSPARKTPSDM
jgi:hypothetical protein